MKQANTNMCTISLGDYGNKLVLPVKDAAAVMALLSQATVVSVEWSRSGITHILVERDSGIKMDINKVDILTQEEFAMIRAAEEIEKAVERAAEKAAAANNEE